MSKFRITHLIKIGEKQYMEKLLGGEIYMKNINYFREYEESYQNNSRGDRYECYDFISQNNKIFILDEMMSKSILEVENVNVFEDKKSFPGYLYCMYAVHSGKESVLIDKRMFEFGDYAIVIFNPNEFIRRIKSYCKERNLHPNCSPVEYYGEKIKKGLITPFMKRDSYSYQSEARIYIHDSNPQENMTLNIGSIKDIA